MIGKLRTESLERCRRKQEQEQEQEWMLCMFGWILELLHLLECDVLRIHRILRVRNCAFFSAYRDVGVVGVLAGGVCIAIT